MLKSINNYKKGKLCQEQVHDIYWLKMKPYVKN
jgi:hypothetical protein